jgi:glycosyltransferase involved in cell wall biosynthesis
MVPLPEAMAGDAVIVARDIPAVRETLAGAGVLFRTPDDALAALVHQICTDAALRAALLARQRARLRAFDQRTFLARLAALVERWLLDAGVRA